MACLRQDIGDNQQLVSKIFRCPLTISTAWWVWDVTSFLHTFLVSSQIFSHIHVALIMFLQGIQGHTVSPFLYQLFFQSPRSSVTSFPQDMSICFESIIIGKACSRLWICSFESWLRDPCSTVAFRSTKADLMAIIFLPLALLCLQDPERWCVPAWLGRFRDSFQGPLLGFSM